VKPRRNESNAPIHVAVAPVRHLSPSHYLNTKCKTCGGEMASYCELCKTRACPGSSSCHPGHNPRASGEVLSHVEKASWAFALPTKQSGAR
jgi:hypothetical protein